MKIELLDAIDDRNLIHALDLFSVVKQWLYFRDSFWDYSEKSEHAAWLMKIREGKRIEEFVF
jgi:hypothetical protein